MVHIPMRNETLWSVLYQLRVCPRSPWTGIPDQWVLPEDKVQIVRLWLHAQPLASSFIYRSFNAFFACTVVHSLTLSVREAKSVAPSPGQR